MTERKTLKLPADDFERHNERRKDLGLSWPEYVDGQAPDAPEGVDDLTERLDDIEATAREAADAAQRADRKVEELQR